jgi:phosphate acetyltransferase
MDTIKNIEANLIADQKKKTIIFPEGKEEKIQQVANYLVENHVGHAILIFPTRKDVPSTLNKDVKVIIQDEFDVQPLIDKFLEIRKEKATLEIAQKAMQHPNYIGAMLVKMGKADAMLSGLTYTTADTIRPALQIIKTKPGVSLATTAMIMQKDDENYFFSDCALNIKPTADQLADITKSVVNFAKSLNVKDPQAVLLSYSTNGSGAGEDVERVVSAVNKLKSEAVDFVFDGEIQFDAAFDLATRTKKFPDSKITKTRPDVFIFPDINVGNIGYKIAQRMGGYKAVGPFILGFNQPVNDLSRGATFDDIRDTAIMTLHQVEAN